MIAQQGTDEAMSIRTSRQAEEAGVAVQESTFGTILEGQAVTVRKNSGGTEVVRPRINLIEGANITISLVDDPVSSEADITITGPAAAPTTAQFVTLATDAALTNERVLTGTPNQIIFTDGGAGAAVTASTPQDIHTGATPTYAGVIVSTGGRLAILPATPAQIIADQNDYNPGTAGFFRLSSDASRNITGILAGATGARMTVINVGANNIVLQNQNAGSALANRIITGTGADITLAPDDIAELWYDLATARWRVL